MKIYILLQFSMVARYLKNNTLFKMNKLSLLLF